MLKSIIYLFIICFTLTLTSQNEQVFDSIFSQWNDNTKPGGTAGIIKDGKVIYLKGFGSANIENNELITPQTKFQLGEMSKQFTSLAILILEEQGKISLNDDIRKYIPELPVYEYTITIEHLLNHSSGLHDINRVSNIINGTMNISTQAKALKLIASQKALSFKPGTDFSFHESVTESVLMAEIVSKSSGQSFAEFVKSNIFEPLGMENSVIRDDSSAILTNVAQPYQKEDDENYKKLEVRSSVVGAINAYTSAEDLSIWYLNYMNPNGNLAQLIQKLDTPVQLSNGKKFVYYWGEMAIGREFTHPERGLPIFWNYGLQGGYGTNVFRYIDQNIISFALGNSNQYNGGLAHNAVDVFVKDLYPLPVEIDFEAKKIKKLSTQKLKAFEGHYWFKEGYASELFVENDTLRTKWLFSPRNRYQTLVPLSDNTFQQYAEMEDQRLFKFKKEGDDMTLFFTYNESRPDIMERYEPVNPSEQALQSYVGTYYNNEYSLLFSFHLEDGQLVASHLNHEDIMFRPIKKDVFTSTSMFFNALEFVRGKTGNIKEFTIKTDGIVDMVFKKISL
ncbi:serine hydrolase domain-containing protein [Winogradskyella sp. R77965]|uniref:serine hydrolase domain-containing protein n=1 Tax=Winogradskyella sp. R77965 TaxID=3093872 RepID=UPI0037DD2160